MILVSFDDLSRVETGEEVEVGEERSGSDLCDLHRGEVALDRAREWPSHCGAKVVSVHPGVDEAVEDAKYPDRLALISVCDPHADNGTGVVVRLQVRDSFSLKQQNDRVDDLVVLAQVEEVGVDTELWEVGGHGAECQLDTLESCGAPPLEEEVDDERKHPRPRPTAVHSERCVMRKDQEAEQHGCWARAFGKVSAAILLDDSVCGMRDDVVDEGESKRQPWTEALFEGCGRNELGEELMMLWVFGVGCGQGVPRGRTEEGRIQWVRFGLEAEKSRHS